MKMGMYPGGASVFAAKGLEKCMRPFRGSLQSHGGSRRQDMATPHSVAATMKLAVALFLAFVAPTEAFVPSNSCRGAITASRTRSTNALVSLILNVAGDCLRLHLALGSPQYTCTVVVVTPAG